MSILIKQGVCGDLSNVCQKALGLIHSYYQRLGEDLVVTSIRDGNHSPGSLHYNGNAFDIRYSTAPIFKISELRRLLGSDFDVIPEKNHIHVEFDPK